MLLTLYYIGCSKLKRKFIYINEPCKRITSYLPNYQIFIDIMLFSSAVIIGQQNLSYTDLSIICVSIHQLLFRQLLLWNHKSKWAIILQECSWGGPLSSFFKRCWFFQFSKIFPCFFMKIYLKIVFSGTPLPNELQFCRNVPGRSFTKFVQKVPIQQISFFS
jgi:hypothetical protein